MQIAIIDYELDQITIFDLPKETEKELREEDVTIGEYVENLPGYHPSYCSYLIAPEGIDLRIGPQEDFPEYNG